MFWNPEIEKLNHQDLKKIQLENVNKIIKLSQKSDYYSKKIKISQNIQSLNEIEQFPFTEKQTLRDHFPYGFLSVSLDECVRLHSSSGTTGTPTVVFYTQDDIDNWAELIARGMAMNGVHKGDIFQNLMGYGLFTGGLGFHYGAEKIGALTIPSGPGNSKRQIWFMKTFQTSVIHILPSYALRLHTFFDELGIELKKDLNLKTAFIGAEPHTEEIRKKIEDIYQIKAYNSYGLSEMTGPGVGFECPEQNGLHIWEDFFYIEIIDPQTGRVLPEGEEGELVLTTLQKSAMPLLRYRTRDITRIIPEPCPCGRTHRKIERIKGRSDDMLIINGVNIYPMQIEKALMKFPEIGNHYIVEIHKENFMDKLYIKVEVHENIFNGTLSGLEYIQHKITEELKTELVVSPIVKLVEPQGLPVNEGKAKRIFDYRSAD